MDNVSYALAMEEICARLRRHRRHHERQQLALLRPDPASSAPRRRSRSSSSRSRAARSSAASRSPSPRSGSDAAEMRTVAVQRGRRVRPQRHEELHHQRPAGRRGRCVFAMTDQAKGHKGITAFLVPTDAKGVRPRQAGRQARHPRLRLVHDLLRGRARSRRSTGSARRATASRSRWRRSTAAASASPRRRSASRAPRSRRRVALREGAQDLRQADRAATRRSSSCSPTWRPRSTRRGCSRLARRVAEGPGRAPQRGERDGEALRLGDGERVTRKAIQIHGGYGYVKEYASSATSATPHHRDLRGHERDPAARHRRASVLKD